jgi:hypothetical protein
LSTAGWARLERWLVVLIALHTYAVGLALMFLTRWGAALGGWPTVEPLFFARQAGVFHLLLGTAYLVDYFRHRSVLLLLVAKATAVVFLGVLTFVDQAPWVVPFSGAADGLMGLAVLVVRRKRGVSVIEGTGREG